MFRHFSHISMKKKKKKKFYVLTLNSTSGALSQSGPPRPRSKIPSWKFNQISFFYQFHRESFLKIQVCQTKNKCHQVSSFVFCHWGVTHTNLGILVLALWLVRPALTSCERRDDNEARVVVFFISGRPWVHTLTHSWQPLRFPEVRDDSFVSNGGADKQSESRGVERALMERQENGRDWDESEKRGDRETTTTDISGNFTGMANPTWSAEDFNI